MDWCNKMKQFGLGALALVLSAAAGAETYVGGVIGASNVDIDCNYASQCDSGDTGVKLYGGYVLPHSPLPQLALEVGYISFGQARASTPVTARTVDVSAFTFGAAMRLKFTPAFHGVGRLGMAYVDATGEGTLGPYLVRSTSDSRFQLYAGLGLEYAITKQVKLVGTADFTSYDTGAESGSARLIGIGAQFGF
jgi:OOP family OmpA-OmpF porin